MPREASTTAGLHRSVGSDGAYAQARPFATHSEGVEDRVRVLVVDGDRAAARGCANLLQPEGYVVTECDGGEDALSLMQGEGFEIALLADTAGIPCRELLRACLRAHERTLVIVMTGSPELPESRAALDEGAWDCLPKPVSVGDLRLRVARAAEAVRLSRAGALPRADIGRNGDDEGLSVLSRSRSFTQILETARRVAPTDASVFITGEAGTGKELVAHYIHRHSRRSGRAIVTLSCAALPEPLLHGELFGYVRGAFPGAVRDKPGLLETVHGGTLFLDEITQLSQALQGRLLRALHDGSVSSPGDGAAAPLDVRFIAATTEDPRRAVEQGELRGDLYYLLCVVPLRLPALRERPDDIPLLAQYFLLHYWSRHRGRQEAVPRLGPAALRALQQRTWPGNVRELQNTIERAVVLLEPGAEIGPEELAERVHDNGAQAVRLLDLALDGADRSYHTSRDRLLANFETRYLSWLLARTAGNMSRAARIAGVDRTTLYRLMEKHGLHRQTVILDGQA